VLILSDRLLILHSVVQNVPIKLKWPNDIYVQVEQEGETHLKKVGGVLVTSSFTNEEFQVVIGNCALYLMITQRRQS
jgi:biotin--protein ligase